MRIQNLFSNVFKKNNYELLKSDKDFWIVLYINHFLIFFTALVRGKSFRITRITYLLIIIKSARTGLSSSVQVASSQYFELAVTRQPMKADEKKAVTAKLIHNLDAVLTGTVSVTSYKWLPKFHSYLISWFDTVFVEFSLICSFSVEIKQEQTTLNIYIRNTGWDRMCAEHNFKIYHILSFSKKNQNKYLLEYS